MSTRDVVVEHDVPWQPAADVPAPIVWWADDRAVVVFNVATAASGGPRAIVEFDGCMSATFGYPNDEALPGHPLYGAGLGYYGVFEVQQSSWIERLKRQNLTMFPNAKWWPNSPHGDSRPLRHFIITFHDSTFECLASEMRGEFTDQSLEDVVRSFVADRR